MALDADKVVTVALRLMGEEGIDAVTTRRLAQELGVQGPALYWHFKNKQELFDHMAARMLPPPFPVSTEEEWSVSLAEAARQARKTILSYRDGARLVAAALPIDLSHRDVGLAYLQAAGFDKDEALYVFLVLGRFVVGWTLAEQSLSDRDERGLLDFDPEAAFEFGLRGVMEGLQGNLYRAEEMRAMHRQAAQ